VYGRCENNALKILKAVHNKTNCVDVSICFFLQKRIRTKIASNDVFKISLPDPVIIKNGSNIIWKNVKEFLRITRRPPDHFVNFLRKESNCVINWISESKSDGLTFSQKKLKSDFLIDHMKIYLKEYVICKSCKSINTYIERDKNLRKYNFICINCNNQYFI
jgi:translation initiation factor 2 beta subunit (eIF-2beta)/eIF-5